MVEGQEKLVWLVDGRRSAMGYWLVHAMAVLQVLGSGALLLHEGVELPHLLLAGVLALSAALFFAVAAVLGARKGGAAFSPPAGGLLLFGRSASDAVAVAAADVGGLALRRRLEDWGGDSGARAISTVELIRRQGAGLLLLEPFSLEDGREALKLFSQVTRWPGHEIDGGANRPPLRLVHRVLSPSPVSPALADDSGVASPQHGTTIPRRRALLSPTIARRPLRFLTSYLRTGAPVTSAGDPERVVLRTGFRYALSLTTALTGLFALVTGALVLAGLAQTGVVGFLFGPFLVALGSGALGLWFFKGLGGERLVFDRDCLRYERFIGAWRFGAMSVTVSPTTACARLRTRAALGFVLELVCGGRVVPVGSGATRGSRLSPQSLLELGDRFVEWAARQPVVDDVPDEEPGKSEEG